MPSLPLTLPFTPGAADPAIQSADDVLAAYPRDYQTASHPVLDALTEAHAAAHIEYQTASDYAASQADLLRATGACLDGLGSDHGVIRQPGELDADYRARILGWQDVVTPEAIVATVNAALAPYTTVLAQYCETILDRWYIEDGTALWGSFLGDEYTVTIGPQYFDRLYPDDDAINGGSRPQSDPGEPLLFTDDLGRCFYLRVPSLNDANGPTAYATDGTGDPELLGLADSFVEDGTAVAGIEMTFASGDFLLADETYAAIVQNVNRIKGAGIRWFLVVDPRLA